MSYGIIEYDEGKPICEICRKSYDRVLSHVRQKHSMSERDYKHYYGFELTKGICSKDSAEKTRERTLANYDKCIGKNLIHCGESTRFIKGSLGRTADMVQEQTRLKLLARLKEPQMVEAMRKSGQRVGKSGLGNKKRWKTK
jgi:hypothetical protein